MGDGRDGHVGRDDGVRDASVSEHNAHANGHARGRGRQFEYGRAARLLSGPGRACFYEQNGGQVGGRLQRSVRLGREDAGHGVVGVLLRVHIDAPARRRSVPEVRRQAHHGPGHIVHGPVHAVNAVRRVHGLHAADHLAVRRRTRRGEKDATTSRYRNYKNLLVCKKQQQKKKKNANQFSSLNKKKYFSKDRWRRYETIFFFFSV